MAVSIELTERLALLGVIPASLTPKDKERVNLAASNPSSEPNPPPFQIPRAQCGDSVPDTRFVAGAILFHQIQVCVRRYLFREES